LLSELRVSELALVEEAYLKFEKGFNILTGETGAGKTVLIEAVNLLVGERADRALVRGGTKEAYIEGVFIVPNNLLPDLRLIAGDDLDEELILARRIFADGGGQAYCNGRRVPTSFLKEIGNFLVDIHGQHEHQSLLKVAKHLDLLDAYGGEELNQVKEDYQKFYSLVKEVSKELEEVSQLEQERLRRIDILHFQVDEIGKANLKEGEEEELGRERNVARNFEKINQSLNKAVALLELEEQGVLDNLRQVQVELENIASCDQVLDESLVKVKDSLINLEEVLGTLQDYLAQLDFDPARLEVIEERLYLIDQLKKKYGQTLEEIEEFYKSAREELERLENLEVERESLTNRYKENLEKSLKKAEQLSQLRKKTGQLLEVEVKKVLSQLQMSKAVFQVKFDYWEGDDSLDESSVSLRQSGFDKVEFLFSPSPGEPLRSLSKVASGGEMSRLMLALKTAFAQADSIPVLIFDEIDAGIGGKATLSIGQLLRQLSRFHQILCVSHLPQIATFAQAHFLVYKEERGERSQTLVKPLSESERLKEVARLLSGDVESDVALQHAREMLERAQEVSSVISSLKA
jgi:DNA repair protein RecN (Recombination protein N)